ncbi:MAG: hypothetical protein JWQ19_3751 [Subtercola sp.]|nr:hypothetical protein [Subtercola sp.]
MFSYFDDRYLWNLSVLGALNGGGLIDEVDRACAPVMARLARGEDVGPLEFYCRVAFVLVGGRFSAELLDSLPSHVTERIMRRGE